MTGRSEPAGADPGSVRTVFSIFAVVFLGFIALIGWAEGPGTYGNATVSLLRDLLGPRVGFLIQAAIAVAGLHWLLFSPVGLSIAKAIDTANVLIGRYVAWLIVVAILISAGNAIIRKLFDRSSNAWLEWQWVLFGAAFLICASWTLWSNEHIRIDIVNSHFSKRTRDWIDVFGHVVFLLPLTMIMIYHSWPFFLRSYAINEQSLNAGGLPQWPSKFLVFVGFVLLFFQAISELIKRVAIIRGTMVDPHASGGGHLAAAEAEAQRLLEVAEAEAQRLLDVAKAEKAAHAAPNK